MKAWHPFFMPRPHSAMCDALGGVYRAVRCDERCGDGEGRNEPAPRAAKFRMSPFSCLFSAPQALGVFRTPRVR